MSDQLTCEDDTHPDEGRPLQSPLIFNDIQTNRGKEIFQDLKSSYQWKEQFDHPSQDFLALMDRLFMECQLHLTAISTSGNIRYRCEADAIINEMIAVRNHWGTELLPNSICNAFVRERISITHGMDSKHFRIDCAQFFEPIPFFGNQHELMKLYRFSVYDVVRNDVVLRYYLKRNSVDGEYSLSFSYENIHGKVHPYGNKPPTYWDIRHRVLGDIESRLNSVVSPSSLPSQTGTFYSTLRVHEFS